MAQWMNLNRNNRYVLTHQYILNCEKNWPCPPTSGSYGRQSGKQTGGRTSEQAGGWAGRQVGRQADIIWVNFKIFKALLQIKLFRLLFYLILLQCYHSIRTAFQLAFIK